MKWVLRAFVVLALGASAVQAHRVRARLAAHDADPAAVTRLSEGLKSIPLVLDGGRYEGSEYPLSPRVVRLSGADVFLSTQYRASNGSLFHLYVGGSIANDENFHAPSYCMPEAGWEVVEEDTVPFDAYSVADEEPRMRRLFLQRGDGRMVVYFWFQAGSRLADDEWRVRFSRLKDLTTGEPLRPTILLVLYAPVAAEREATETEAREFLRAVGTHLKQAISR